FQAGLRLCINDLRARLTDPSVGKAARTSGASSARFVPARNRSRCLPRTPPLSSEASYSGRRSSSWGVASFLIDPPLPSRRSPGADDPDPFASVGVRYDEQVAFARMTERQEAVLLVRVIGIGESQGQRIPKDGGRFMEANTMLGHVALCLLCIPLEVHKSDVTG